MREGVLILHNTVDGDVTGRGNKLWPESNAGVLEEVRTVRTALERLGLASEVKSLRSIRELPGILTQSKYKIVFNLVEELAESLLDACYVPAICRAHGKGCTGNNTVAMLLGQNKWHSKLLLKAAKLPCADGIVVPLGQKLCQEHLKPGKYIVKPVYSDASEGISAASVVEVPSGTADEIVQLIHRQLQQPALIEQFVPCRELNVSVLERENEIHVLPLAEIDFSAFSDEQVRIVDYSAKWLTTSFAYNNTPLIIPARLDEQTADLVRRYTTEAWWTFGCNDYTRVDFRLDEQGQPFIIEINPNPDISPDAGLAAALTASNISYESFVECLLENAMRRLRNQAARSSSEKTYSK